MLPPLKAYGSKSLTSEFSNENKKLNFGTDTFSKSQSFEITLYNCSRSWDKIDFDNRRALIDSGWDNKNGFKDYTKNNRDRVIELAPDLIHILKELKIKNGASSVFVLPRISSWDKGELHEELRKVLQGLALPVVRFHDLRASWATVMLSRGIAPLKVMAMGGREELKTMQIYVRKAGIDIAGISDGLSLHNPGTLGEVLNFKAAPSVN